ncbi:hypothetical protein [Streptomyces sp. NPDC090053]|uniref:hypothetical protein n=1 Tax=Streptomyces sp. NPDC090053 TaxID=3365932 RepID=UPI0037F428A8
MKLLRRIFSRRNANRPAAAERPRHTCQDTLDRMPMPGPGPLMTELLATLPHTRNLAALAEREPDFAEEYQFIARSIIRDVFTGYRAATRGRGLIEDLLIDDVLTLSNHPASRLSQTTPALSAPDVPNQQARVEDENFSAEERRVA